MAIAVGSRWLNKQNFEVIRVSKSNPLPIHAYNAQGISYIDFVESDFQDNFDIVPDLTRSRFISVLDMSPWTVLADDGWEVLRVSNGLEVKTIRLQDLLRAYRLSGQYARVSETHEPEDPSIACKLSYAWCKMCSRVHVTSRDACIKMHTRLGQVDHIISDASAISQMVLLQCSQVALVRSTSTFEFNGIQVKNNDIVSVFTSGAVKVYSPKGKELVYCHTSDYWYSDGWAYFDPNYGWQLVPETLSSVYDSLPIFDLYRASGLRAQDPKEAPHVNLLALDSLKPEPDLAVEAPAWGFLE